MSQHEIIFASYAETNEQLRHLCLLVESLREFAGEYSQTPLLIFVPQAAARDRGLTCRLQEAGAGFRAFDPPGKCAWFNYAGKTFAAGLAEHEAGDIADILVWLDDDTIFLAEPEDFRLDAGIGLAYRPVMHNRSGSLYREPPSPFWAQIYESLDLDPESLLPMTTPADQQTIRAYFNAGVLAVRPELNILRGWGESFTKLCEDSALVQMCEKDAEKRIFLHQTALVGAVCHRLAQSQMLELSDRYNYPLFFKQQFGATAEFDDITDVVTLRHDTYFRNPDPDWATKLKGPPEKIAWLKSRMA